jgi:hypothetical protein
MSIKRVSLPIIILVKQQDIPIERLNPDNVTVEYDYTFDRHIIEAIHRVALGDKEVIREKEDTHTYYHSVADSLWDKLKETLLEYPLFNYLRYDLNWTWLDVKYKKIPYYTSNLITEKHYHICPYPVNDTSRVIEFMTAYPTAIPIVTDEIDAHF